MARPADWYVLDLASDPVPGDPWQIRDLAGRLRTIGDDAEYAARGVRGLVGDQTTMTWIGAAGDAFRDHIGSFPGQLDKVANSHHMCSAALSGYADSLDGAQSQADRALTRARPLFDQVKSLRAQLGDANQANSSANRDYSTLSAATQPDADAVAAAVRNRTTAQHRVDTLNSQMSSAEAELEALRALAHQAAGLRDHAADTARTLINAATDAGIPPDSFWHKLGEIAAAAWDALIIIAKIVSFIGAIVLLFVGGPLWLIIAVVLAGVLILADTLYKYSQGKATLWDVGLSLLACIPITKGFTTLAALQDAFRAGGLLGAGLHLGGATLGAAKDLLTGMGSLLKGGFGKIVSLFGDGAKATQPVEFLHSGNMAQAFAKEIFPGLEKINPNFPFHEMFQINCQKCVVAVDNMLAGRGVKEAAGTVTGGPFEIPWPRSVNFLADGAPFVHTPSYEAVAHELGQAGDGARGIMWGRRFFPDPANPGQLIEGTGHVFNVVNKGGTVYFLDGQVGGFAYLEAYHELQFLRTG